MRKYWLDGVMGVVVGDALGCPVQFMGRAEIANRECGPVTGMEGYGTANVPPGTWTDDSALTLALLSSIRDRKSIDLVDVMDQFVLWLENGEYTPFQYSFDIGFGTMNAIERYETDADVMTCGGTTERDNGNGSLMRILPACLYAYEQQKNASITDEEAIRLIDSVSGLTHNHLRAKIGCGLYYFCVKAVLDETGLLKDRLQVGLNHGFEFYEVNADNRDELARYSRISDLDAWGDTDEADVRGSGYVVEALEAAIWSAISTSSYKECGLRCVNLGDDTDTVAAIAGGLTGLYYGYDGIPAEWLDVIQRREWIEDMLRN